MKLLPLTLLLSFFFACTTNRVLVRSGQHYQKYQDYASLKKVVDGIKLGADASRIKKLLGEPIDMGFDYRYPLDTVGENFCMIGAVFHLNEQGKTDQKWIGEICE